MNIVSLYKTFASDRSNKSTINACYNDIEQQKKKIMNIAKLYIDCTRSPSLIEMPKIGIPFSHWHSIRLVRVESACETHGCVYKWAGAFLKEGAALTPYTASL